MTARLVNTRAATTAVLTGVVLGVVSAVGSLGAATYFARRLITPEHEKTDDTTILAVAPDSITLRADPHTLSPGRYGLWLDGGAGHLRIGDVLSVDARSRRSAEHTVTREVLGVDAGRPAPGPARWNPYYYSGDPGALGVPFRDVLVPSDVGDLPAWRVEPERPGHRWAILVHGRSARREETLRAVPVLREVGMTVLVPMYRNDFGAPASIDGRYNLGLSEWRDVEAAIRYAVSHGAREVVLLGWSMGGAIVLQTLDRSGLSTWVTRVVLDGPVIDWGDVITYQAGLNNLPRSVDLLSRVLLRRRFTRGLVGIAEPIDIAVTDWVERSAELHHPILLIHSASDDVVPCGPSQELARKRPDLVQFAPWDLALHCREWNTDTQRWEQLVRDFLSDPVPAAAGRSAASDPRRG